MDYLKIDSDAEERKLNNPEAEIVQKVKKICYASARCTYYDINVYKKK